MFLPEWFSKWAPVLFVFLWSTGFIGSKFGAPYAEPLTFLFVRFVIAAVLLSLLVPLFKEPWLQTWSQVWHAAVVGVLLHGFYLGGVFIAIDRGVDAGFSALIVGLQPLLTVMLAALWLREVITRSKMMGIVAGLVGVVLVLADSGLSVTGLKNLDSIGLVFCLFALIGITLGTLYQKRFCHDIPLVSGAVVQYAAVALVLFPLTKLFETQTLVWSPTFVFALMWLVIVLSLGAVLLLMQLLRRGEAGQVASLFYLVPPIVALEAWLLFDERLTLIGVCGFILCAAGVALVVREPRQRAR